jgi:hypothetical protein
MGEGDRCHTGARSGASCSTVSYVGGFTRESNRRSPGAGSGALLNERARRKGGRVLLIRACPDQGVEEAFSSPPPPQVSEVASHDRPSEDV